MLPRHMSLGNCSEFACHFESLKENKSRRVGLMVVGTLGRTARSLFLPLANNGRAGVHI